MRRGALLPTEQFPGLCVRRLLEEAERLQLEGIVSKRRSAPYRSGERSDWRKIKTASWREANRERFRLFEKP